MSQTRAETHPPAATVNADGAATFPIFFYGSLMDPEMLNRVVGLSTPQTTVSATLSNYAIKLWGSFPALVPRAGSKVQGVVWNCTPAQFDRLEYYEGYAYTWTECDVEVQDGQSVDGKETSVIKGCRVFVAKYPESDELEEGEWSLEKYQKYWNY